MPLDRRIVAAAALAAAVAGCDAGREGKPAASPGPTLSIASPRMDETIQGDEALLMLDLRNYAIGKVEPNGTGPHVHVILDDEPYEAIYDASKGIPLGKPDASGKRILSEGTHVVRAFPSAGPWKKDGDPEHHESRKNAGAFAWVRFHYKRREGPLGTFDATQPTLTYSRPKGEYLPGTRERDRLLLDFYVTGTTLTPEGHRVKVTVDGKDATLTDLAGKPVEGSVLTEWKPYLIAPTPPPGEHVVAIELQDREGKRVDSGRDARVLPFARTERKITVK